MPAGARRDRARSQTRRDHRYRLEKSRSDCGIGRERSPVPSGAFRLQRNQEDERRASRGGASSSRPRRARTRKLALTWRASAFAFPRRGALSTPAHRHFEGENDDAHDDRAEHDDVGAQEDRGVEHHLARGQHGRQPSPPPTSIVQPQPCRCAGRLGFRGSAPGAMTCNTSCHGEAPIDRAASICSWLTGRTPARADSVPARRWRGTAG